MSLNIWSLGLAKALGLEYGAAQLVFFRALVGCIVIVPWAVQEKRSFRNIDRLWVHGFRVAASTIALTASFFAIARLPFALVTAINFTRPILMMILAVLFLSETIGPRRWIAAGIAFTGVFIAVSPGSVPFSYGLPAIGLSVLFGTLAIILTRSLSHAPVIVLMTFYTAGLAIIVSPWAFMTWVPIEWQDMGPMLLIGICAQSAQYCFLKAHRRAEAGFLAVLSYLSLPLSAGAGFLFFDEIPTLGFAAGASLIVISSIWISWRNRSA